MKEDRFMHSSYTEHFVIRAKLMELIDWSYTVEGIFPVANMLALAIETIETHPDLDHWELAKR